MHEQVREPHLAAAQTIPRVASFRASLAASLGHPVEPKRRILFQLRRGGARHIVNEAEFRSSIEEDPMLRGRVRFAVMEHLPVMEQYALVASSFSLAGVHGMGLAWTMLGRLCACFPLRRPRGTLQRPIVASGNER